MSKQNIDFRDPESFLKTNSINHTEEELELITNLGKKYRELKNILKEDLSSKKILSKKFNEIKKDPLKRLEHANDVSLVTKKIKKNKSRIQEVERNIIEFFSSTTGKEIFFPPQFSEQRDEKTLLKINIIELDLSIKQQWDDYINSHPNATIYHTLETKRVIEKTFNHESLYLLARNEDGSICGALPLIHMKSRLFGDFWSSMPFFNYGGVLADNELIRVQLINSAWEKIASTESQYIEYRHANEIKGLPSRSDKVSMILKLPDDKDQLWDELSSKVRAQIKKAASYSYKVKIGKDELIKDFYKVFSRNMRDLGTPVYPIDFFTNLLAEHPSATIIILYMENKPVSVGFTVGWRNTLEIPWASTIREANKYNSNMLMYWHILEFAIKGQHQFFDFGRSSKNASTHRFKKQWGAKEHQLYWQYNLHENGRLPSLNISNPKYDFAIRVWKKIPVWVTRIVGPQIVKYIP